MTLVDARLGLQTDRFGVFLFGDNLTDEDGAARQYPEVLIYTSTRDDRVHPGHGRRLAARFEELGRPILYYENMEGGHAGADGTRSAAALQALQLVYLFQKLPP